MRHFDEQPQGLSARRATLALLVLSAALLGGCGGEDAPAVSGPVAVNLPESAITVAKRREVRPEFRLPAAIEAIQSAAIRPQISARLVANHFTAGDMVEKGQLLVELDNTEVQVALEAAQADVSAASAAVLNATSTWERAQKLNPDGYISKADFDTARANYDATQAALDKARARVAQAELDLSYTRISAPFSGKISRPQHAVGDLVSPSSQVPLLELVQLDPIYVSAGVELSVYNRFMMLRQKLLSEGRDIPEIEVTLELAGGEVYPHPGTFISWDNTSQAMSGAVLGRAEFVNTDGILLPESNVVIRGQAIEAIDRIFVPQRCVLQDQQGYYVLIVNETNEVARRNLTMGVRDGAEWAVLEGLTVGDRVIVEGATRLAPGTAVTIGNDASNS